MPNVPDIIRLRNHRRGRATRRLARTGLGCSAVASLITAILAVFAALIFSNLTRDLPSIESLPALMDPPDGLLLQPTQLYDRTGENLLLALEPPEGIQRKYLSWDPSLSASIPPEVISTTLALHDPAFWTHGGASFSGITGDGQPTLAQQLASDLLLWEEPPGFGADCGSGSWPSN